MKAPEYRRAILDDVPRIVEQLERFYGKTKAYEIPFHEDSAILSVINVVKRGICLVGSKSVAGAMIQAWPFNFGFQISEVVFWFFESPRQITILEALAKECYAAGADYIVATQHPGGAIGRHYRKLNFLEVENHFISRLPLGRWAESACSKSGTGLRTLLMTKERESRKGVE